jgi:hypothetical protein
VQYITKEIEDEPERKEGGGQQEAGAKSEEKKSETK